MHHRHSRTRCVSSRCITPSLLPLLLANGARYHISLLRPLSVLPKHSGGVLEARGPGGPRGGGGCGGQVGRRARLGGGQSPVATQCFGTQATDPWVTGAEHAHGSGATQRFGARGSTARATLRATGGVLGHNCRTWGPVWATFMGPRLVRLRPICMAFTVCWPMLARIFALAPAAASSMEQSLPCHRPQRCLRIGRTPVCLVPLSLAELSACCCARHQVAQATRLTRTPHPRTCVSYSQYIIAVQVRGGPYAVVPRRPAGPGGS